MDTEDIIQEAQSLEARIRRFPERGLSGSGTAAQAQVCEFLRNYAGPKSAFLRTAEAVKGTQGYRLQALVSILQSFIEYVQAGLATGVSPERQAQLDVVSDLLGQANSLLDDTKYHPGAAAILIGACLEEFLRTWVEAESLSIGKSKPGIDAYSKVLRGDELISKDSDRYKVFNFHRGSSL